jgi:hypothetical protein
MYKNDREPDVTVNLLNYKFYSQDLLNNIFKHPYTKIEFIENDLGVSKLQLQNI